MVQGAWWTGWTRTLRTHPERVRVQRVLQPHKGGQLGSRGGVQLVQVAQVACRRSGGWVGGWVGAGALLRQTSPAGAATEQRRVVRLAPGAAEARGAEAAQQPAAHARLQ